MVVVASISDKVGDVGGYLREQREHARLSVRQLATLAGVSNPYLSQVERGLRKPSAEVLQQIARGLRISAEALYVRAGILDEENRPDVEAAVASDPELNDRQRRVLLDIYASFRAENRRAQAEADGAATAEPAPRRTAGARKSARVTVRKTARARVRPAVPGTSVPTDAQAGSKVGAETGAEVAPGGTPSDPAIEPATERATEPPTRPRVRAASKRATPRASKRTAVGSGRAARKAAAAGNGAAPIEGAGDGTPTP
jgi:transcriptional regulator with XRE-family HTH domain